MTPLVDVNVVLDVLLVRQPWFAESARIWDAHRDGEISATIAGFTIPTIFYIMRRQTDLQGADDAVRICLATFDIAPVQRSTLELARTLTDSDYEDKLQIAYAIEGQHDLIVTRNPNDFAAAPMRVFTPAQLAAILPQRKS
jgi:hypothetical protein